MARRKWAAWDGVWVAVERLEVVKVLKCRDGWNAGRQVRLGVSL